MHRDNVVVGIETFSPPSQQTTDSDHQLLSVGSRKRGLLGYHVGTTSKQIHVHKAIIFCDADHGGYLGQSCPTGIEKLNELEQLLPKPQLPKRGETYGTWPSRMLRLKDDRS